MLKVKGSNNLEITNNNLKVRRQAFHLVSTVWTTSELCFQLLSDLFTEALHILRRWDDPFFKR